MVLFSCCSYAANRATSVVLPGRTDIISAAGAFVIGSLGNIYSRLVRGTAFTSMVTGVLFLVPVRPLQSKGERVASHILLVRHCSRRWLESDVPQLGGAILKWIFAGSTDDLSGCWSDYRTVC
jgi:hypothetical protein